MIVSKPFLYSINSLKQHLLIASFISSSVLNFNGSILSLKVPSKSVGSYIIIVIDSLNYLRDNV